MTRESKPSRSCRTARVVSRALVTMLAIVGLSVTPAHAADASFSLDFGNAYIWRGIVFNDSGVAQFTLDAGSLNAGSVPISFNVWGNYDIGDFDGNLEKNQISEIDLTVSAGLPAGFEVGLIDYEFPQSPASTQELYVSWSKELTLTPTVAFYYDFRAVDSFYATVDVAYSYAVGEKTSLDLGALVAVAGEDFAKAYGGQKGGFYNYNLSAGVSHTIHDTVGLGVTVGYSGSLDKEVLPEQPLGFFVLGGISFAF
jgi:hypothetical protein